MLPSPCIKACRLDPATGLCRGCRRTIAEIVRWPDADEAEQGRILAEIGRRQARAAGAREADSPDTTLNKASTPEEARR